MTAKETTDTTLTVTNDYSVTPVETSITGTKKLLGDSAKAAGIVAEVFTDCMKVAHYAAAFGGEHPMTRPQIDFIDNWDVENYRRKMSAAGSHGRAENKIESEQRKLSIVQRWPTY